ncbi:MAG TPA: protein translocase subunit SecF [Gemmatimonadaceae bacterium]|nr:protein translocase subunit SecF [Gemmatimonadaceae bacterium]
MLRILHGTRYDFIRWWRWAAGLTIAFILLGLATIAITGGFRYSIEFTGGTLMQLSFRRAPDVARLRSALDAGGLHSAEITRFGDDTTYTVRVQSDTGSAGAEAVARRVEAVLTGAVGEGAFAVVRTEGVGPKVGAELRRGALIAILISFGVTLIYLAWRFEWRFGLAADIATFHDILTTIAFIKLMDLEISLTVIAALLTVLGYSLNDTIIIFDRVRENLRKNRREPLYETLNRSVNETLPRSILTHATTLATTIALLIFAGEVIRPFAWVMAFGIFTGTFSSIYVASPILLWIERKYPRADTAKGGGASPRPVVKRSEPARKGGPVKTSEPARP